MSCSETHSTLRIFSDDLAPDEITQRLGIEPTRTIRKGETHGKGRFTHEANGWFYITENISDSTDSGQHIDLILTALESKEDVVKKLKDGGCKIDIMSFWVGTGQGGPSLVPEQMLKLGMLGIGVWWDIYFDDESDE